MEHRSFGPLVFSFPIDLLFPKSIFSSVMILQQMMQMPGLNPLRHFEPLVGVRSCHQRKQNTTVRRTCSHGRSQGLRRHVLQSYLKRESNCCAVYNYAKYHSDHNSAAMELPGWIYGREIELWMEACFGKDSNVRDATVSDADR